MSISAMALALIAAVSPSVAGVTASADTAPSSGCHIHALALPAGTTSSSVTAGDATGHWLAGTGEVGGESVILRWHDGVPSMVEIPFDDVSISGINKDGAIAGTGFIGSGSYAFELVDHGYTELSAPHARNSWATGIDGAGRVVGFAEFTRSPRRAVVWALDDAQSLRTPRTWDSRAAGVSSDGQIGVVSTFQLTQSVSYVFDQDGRRHSLLPTHVGFDSIVTGVASGWAAGIEVNPVTGDSTVIRWRLDHHRSPQAIESSLYPTSVNASGVIGGQLDSFAAGLIVGTETVALPSLADGQPGYVATVADSGQAAGSSSNSQFVNHAVTWTC